MLAFVDSFSLVGSLLWRNMLFAHASFGFGTISPCRDHSGGLLDRSRYTMYTSSRGRNSVHWGPLPPATQSCQSCTCCKCTLSTLSVPLSS
ncbi:hypothetical protein BDZ91DRAFT_183707 [Kalaharituber pfeilii]|nr:hypothetical protein BDZ91DRAFT_183707 [Kalaharituber pfeilii]